MTSEKKIKYTPNVMFVDVASDGSDHYLINVQPSNNDLDEIIITPTNKSSDIITKSFYKAHLETETQLITFDFEKTNESSNITTPVNTAENSLLVPTREIIKCVACNNFSGTTKEQLIQHTRKYHKKITLHCDYCKYFTYSKVLFDNHVLAHDSELIKCEYCDHCSVSKVDFLEHKQTHFPDNPLKYPTQFDPETKTKSNICNKKESKLICFTDSNMQNSEVCNNDNVDIVKYVRALNKNQFTCSVCQWNSSNKRKILLHLVHHPQQIDYPDIDLSILRKYKILPH